MAKAYCRWQSRVEASLTRWPQGSRASILIMKVPYTKSGKCGNMVWQRARYGQICYLAFTPFNPSTPAQVAVRGNFGAVSKRWRTLTEEQRMVWNAVARSIKSKPRLFQCGSLPGFNLFVKVNVSLSNQGKSQVDLPPGYTQSQKQAVSGLLVTSEGRSKNEESRKLPQQPVSQGGGQSRLAMVGAPISIGLALACCQTSPKSGRAKPIEIGAPTLSTPRPVSGLLGGVFASKRDTGTGGTPLRYRSTPIVPLCYYRSNTLAGRCTPLCPQGWLRFPCRSRPRRCRSPTRGVCRAVT